VTTGINSSQFSWADFGDICCPSSVQYLQIKHLGAVNCYDWVYVFNYAKNDKINDIALTRHVIKPPNSSLLSKLNDFIAFVSHLPLTFDGSDVKGNEGTVS